MCWYSFLVVHFHDLFIHLKKPSKSAKQRKKKSVLLLVCLLLSFPLTLFDSFLFGLPLHLWKICIAYLLVRNLTRYWALLPNTVRAIPSPVHRKMSWKSSVKWCIIQTSIYWQQPSNFLVCKLAKRTISPIYGTVTYQQNPLGSLWKSPQSFTLVKGTFGAFDHNLISSLHLCSVLANWSEHI